MTIRTLISTTLALALTAIVAGAGCPPPPPVEADSGVAGDASTADASTAPDIADTPDLVTSPDVTTGPPPILSNGHTGWQNKQCSSCHNPLPAGHDPATGNAFCAECHGGNGACNPPGNHNETRDCGNCHSGKHGFSDNAECVSCHYASAGTINCP